MVAGSRSVHNAVLAAVDATRLEHIPPSLPLGPYTVIKGRIIVPVTTNALDQRTVMLLGAYGRGTTFDTTCSPIVSILGVGTGIPGVTETYGIDNLIAAYDGASFTSALANGALHALTVTINCTSSATSAQGLIYYGCVNQRVNRGNFLTYNELADSLISRREFSSASGYSLCTKPHKFSAYPVDIVDWSSQKPIVVPNGTLTDNIALDSLSQMAIIFPATTAAVNYTITINTEWRVNFTDVALASTSIKRPVAPSQIWDKVMDMGANLAGNFHLEPAESYMLSSLTGGAVGSNTNMINQAMSALGTLGTAYQTLSKFKSK